MIASTSSPVLVGLMYATFLGPKFISQTVSGNQTPTVFHSAHGFIYINLFCTLSHTTNPFYS